MPSVRASARVSTKGWAPTQNASLATPANSNAPDGEGLASRNPFMHASMPLMASTNDALSQFYSNANQPQQRILPARPGGNVL